ncbi:MAG: GNAT family protein [Bacteroidota bacterium]
MIFLESERLALRALTETDATDTYLAWINDPEITKGLEAGKYPSTMEELLAYIRAMQNSPGTVMMAIIEKASQRHIGNIKLHNFDWIARTCELGLMIGDKQTRGKRYGQESCQLLINYAFGRLNMRKVWLAVYQNNPAAIKTYQNLGFQTEGCLSQHIYADGAYHDKLFMSLFSPTINN